MATHYVDSAAAGANDGTSWTDAWTSIASATGVAAGDTVLVDDGHSQNLAGNVTLTFTNGTRTNPVKILSVDKADDSLSTGALVTNGTTNDTTWNGNIYVHGLTTYVGRTLYLAATNGTEQTWDNCTLGIVSGAAAGSRFIQIGNLNCRVRFIECAITFTHGNAGSEFELNGGCGVIIQGGTITPHASQTDLFDFDDANQNYRIIVSDVDLTSFPNKLINIIDVNVDLLCRRCNVPSAWISSGAYNGTFANNRQFVLLENCANGTISVPSLGLTRLDLLTGSVATTLSRYRTGGADDGEQANPYSWDMTSNANAVELYNYLESPPIVRWVASGSQTLTVYVASGVTLQNDEFWIEVSSPDEGGSPTAQGTLNSTRLDPQGTPANLTTDATSTWNGTGVGTKQKIDVAITPAVAGPVTVRCFLAKPSTSVYVDPKIGVA